MRRVAVALLLCTTFAAAPWVALAQPAQPPLDELLDIGSRRVRSGSEDGDAWATAHRENGTGIDRVTVAQRGPVFLVAERTQDDYGALRVAFTRLVEFRDADADGRLTSADAILRSVPLRGGDWERGEASFLGDGHRLRAVAPLGDDGGVALSLRANGTYADVDARTVAIDGATLGVEVARPADMRNGTLALVASTREVGDPVAPAAGGDATRPWPASATVDGATVPVTVQVARGDARPGDAHRSEVVFLVLG